MKKNLLCSLALFGLMSNAVFAQETDVFAQIPEHLRPKLAGAGSAAELRLDSVWESGFPVSPADSVVFIKEFYAYFGDTVRKKDVFTYLPNADFYQRETRRLNPIATAQDLYSFNENLFNGQLDTSDMLVTYPSPVWPESSDSTKSYFRPFDGTDLRLQATSSVVYNVDQKPINTIYNNYDVSTGQFQGSLKFEYTYLPNEMVDEVLTFQRSDITVPWQLTGTDEYHYTDNVLDSIVQFSYNTGTGFIPAGLYTFAFNPAGQLTQFRSYNWTAGAYTPNFFLELIYDNEGRVILNENYGFSDGAVAYGAKIFTTYVTGDYVQLEKRFSLDAGAGYQFQSAREYFYSGSVGTADHPAIERLVLAPNPVAHTLRINVPAGTWLEVRAANGQAMMRRRLNQEGEHMLDVGALPAGLYFVSALTPSGQRNGTFVKL